MSRLNVLLTVLIVAGLLAGCGATATPTVTPAPVATATTQRAMPTAQPAAVATGTMATSAGASTLTVFAAASLTAAFTDIGKAYEAAHPEIKVVFSFAGSQALRTQIEQGARADIFASADVSNMTQANTAGLIQGSSSIFTKNKLVVIVPSKATIPVTDIKDLTKTGLKLVICDATVPVGNYALQVIDKYAADASYGADFKTKVLANIVSKENNVKQVVSKIALGEADAGIVYTTDAIAEPEKVKTIAVPDTFNVVAEYPIAIVKGSSNATAAQSFVDYVLSASGQATMAKYGFAAK